MSDATTVEPKDERDETEQGVPDAKAAYDAFNVVWSKVQRHVRAERENQARMRIVRAYFDQQLVEEAERADADRRAAIATIVGAVLDAKTPPDGEEEEGEEEEPASAIHLALRVCRSLSSREWEMVKAIGDLHKFDNDAMLEILVELQETHCPQCGAWLDDEDEHEDCPAVDEGEGEGEEDDASEAATIAPPDPVPTTSEPTMAEESSPPVLATPMNVLTDTTA